MQISWQAQRFVKLEVQILCGNLGRASKPKSHPGRCCIKSFISRTKGSLQGFMCIMYSLNLFTNIAPFRLEKARYPLAW